MQIKVQKMPHEQGGLRVANFAHATQSRRVIWL